MNKVKDTAQEELDLRKIKYKDIICEDTGEVVDFKNYFSSKHWNYLRMKYNTHLREKGMGNTCECCGKERITGYRKNVHHLTYKNIGNESFDELMVLCNVCHEKAHNKEHVTIKEKIKKFQDFKKCNLQNDKKMI